MVANATTQVGVFTIHQSGGAWYLEIPTEMLGRPFFWYTEMSRLPADLSALGAGMDKVAEKMVAFERIGNTVVVNELSTTTTKRSDPGKDAALDRAVAESALPSVLLSLPIVDESPTGALVVEFGAPLSFDLPDFSVGNYYTQRGATAQFEPDRSFVQEMDAYPNNIGVSSLLTFLVTPPRPAYNDQGNEITRFRLEKRDPTAALSEPVQPIVFYISREVPACWSYRALVFCVGFRGRRAGAAPALARRDPRPALRQIVTHEVGHALGLAHKASQAFTIDQLRDPEFTSQHGTAATCAACRKAIIASCRCKPG